MKLRITTVLAFLPLLLSVTTPLHADDVVPSRADQVAAIHAQYDATFDAQYARILALKSKAAKDAGTNSKYKAMLADFTEVRRVINEGLVSESSELVSIKAYAEEETGEFALWIPQMEQQVASIKTISCIKGKLIKKVTAIKPACPKGYKKK